MAIADLSDWLDDQTRPHTVWYLKRLSANDTGQTGGHQAGVYMPKRFMFDLFSALNQEPTKNLDSNFDLYVDSHGHYAEARAIWYNNRYWRKPTPSQPRDEMRITRFGGKASPLQNPENTGALALFSFIRSRPSALKSPACHVWVCEEALEEDLIEERTGPIDPGRHLIWEPAISQRSDLFEGSARTDCRLHIDEIPKDWLEIFPTGAEIVEKAVEMRPDRALTPDRRLLSRRECEYDIFLSVEQAIELPRIETGFASVEEFISCAQTILQRRKSRSGRSLELHVRAIFSEEGLQEGTDFEWQAKSERGKTPDFLFPNSAAYQNADFPPAMLRLLATKTTCKDRWRQVAEEAQRLPVKHLLTLQEGVSESQFSQMRDAGVHLVVPSGLVGKYPKSIRPHLITFKDFICDVRTMIQMIESG